MKYKGRLYCWVTLNAGGALELPPAALAAFEVQAGERLLSIRGSNLAFVMGVKGRIIEYANQHPGIPVFVN